MHLTFVGSEGLEQSALSIISVRKSKKMTFDDGADYLEESDPESGFLIVDENSPLLRNLDPPGTSRAAGNVRHGKRPGYNSLLNFKIRRGPNTGKGIPLVVIITGVGMAVMVILGFLTMFQDNVKAPEPTQDPFLVEITTKGDFPVEVEAVTELPVSPVNPSITDQINVSSGARNSSLETVT